MLTVGALRLVHGTVMYSVAVVVSPSVTVMRGVYVPSVNPALRCGVHVVVPVAPGPMTSDAGNVAVMPPGRLCVKSNVAAGHTGVSLFLTVTVIGTSVPGAALVADGVSVMLGVPS
jgi:hypothetical protein